MIKGNRQVPELQLFASWCQALARHQHLFQPKSLHHIICLNVSHLAVPFDKLTEAFVKLFLETILGEHDGVLPVVHGRLPAGLVHGIEPADLLSEPSCQLCVLSLKGLEAISTLQDKQ